MTDPKAYGWTLPCVRGRQAGQEFYTAMVPFRMIHKFFEIEGAHQNVKARSQRAVNRRRAKEIAAYLKANPENYVLPALTANIDGEHQFLPQDDNMFLGELHIRMDTTAKLIDGQHRATGIYEALTTDKKLASELRDHHVPVTFFVYLRLNKRQQFFADINSNAKSPTNSLTSFYDHRDEISEIARKVADWVKAFNGRIEFERSSVSGKSGMLFSFAQLTRATKAFYMETEDRDALVRNMVRYWDAVAEAVERWLDVEEDMKENRETFISGHAVFLYALAEIGNFLHRHHPTEIEDRAARLAEFDFARSNDFWRNCPVSEEGRMLSSRDAITGLRMKLETAILRREAA